MNALIFIIPMMLFGILACVFAHLYYSEKESRIQAEKKLAEFGDRVVNIEDKAPKGTRSVDNVMCLQNKLKHYVQRDGTKVRLTILK